MSACHLIALRQTFIESSDDKLESNSERDDPDEELETMRQHHEPRVMTKALMLESNAWTALN